MIEFEWPWLLLLVPLPWIMRRFLSPLAPTEEAALRVPFMAEFSTVQSGSVQFKQSRQRLFFAFLAWLLLLVATARPQWLGEAVELPVSGRSLMLAVDLSGSMEVEDFRLKGERVNRLRATQAVAGAFIERRIGDRLGLILFGKQAYLQTPLTFDRKTVHTLLDEAVIGLAGKETAIGDAIGLAVKRLKDNKADDRVLILLTDGANTAGEVEPIKAASLAKAEGLKIYTIGIGADAMIVSSFFGKRKVNPSVDLDEKTLTAIAEMTGGRYFRARSTKQFEKIYRLLDKLEPIEQETQMFRPTSALYPWPLGAAMLIAALLLLRKSFTHV